MDYEFGKSILENITAMSRPRDIEDVAKECDIAFNQGGGKIYGLVVIKAKEPLRAAIDCAYHNDVTCLVIEHTWFCKVPSRKSNLKGWLDSLKFWENLK